MVKKVFAYNWRLASLFKNCNLKLPYFFELSLCVAGSSQAIVASDWHRLHSSAESFGENEITAFNSTSDSKVGKDFRNSKRQKTDLALLV